MKLEIIELSTGEYTVRISRGKIIDFFFGYRCSSYGKVEDSTRDLDYAFRTNDLSLAKRRKNAMIEYCKPITVKRVVND